MGREPDKAAIVGLLVEQLQPEGAIVLAEAIPRHSQRLHSLLNSDGLGQALHDRLTEAEEAIYTQADDPLMWDADDLQRWFVDRGCTVTLELERSQTELWITPNLLDRWFTVHAPDSPSYADRLQQWLTAAEIETVRQHATHALANQTVQWESTIVYLWAQPIPLS